MRYPLVNMCLNTCRFSQALATGVDLRAVSYSSLILLAC